MRTEKGYFGRNLCAEVQAVRREKRGLFVIVIDFLTQLDSAFLTFSHLFATGVYNDKMSFLSPSMKFVFFF